MEIPKIKSRNRNLTARFGIMMTPEMKNKIDELKTFKSIDMPELIREMISEQIIKIEDSFKKGQVTWK